MQKRFYAGDIVYWCENRKSGRYGVNYGMVDEQFLDVVCIDLLRKKETRYVDGIPIDQFETEQRYRKLPKGWTYSTKLFQLEWRSDPEEERFLQKIKIDQPEMIKKAYELGLLVKSDQIFHGHIEADITKEGFRIIKKYPMWQHHITHISIRSDQVYFTYQEAQKEVEKQVAALERMANLSEYDWAVELIDQTLKHWEKLQNATEEEVSAYRNWLLSMKHVEDIEIRIYSGNIQWKYLKNTKWHNVVL